MIQAETTRRYCGREFSPHEIGAIRRLIEQSPHLSRLQISRIVCQDLKWFKPDGGLKDMSCRVALLRMQKDGLIVLPPPRNIRPNKKTCRIVITPRTSPGPAVKNSVRDFGSIEVTPVASKDQSQLWNEYIHRYHYLGFKTLPGAQIRYFVHSGSLILALSGFGAAAWKVAPRDEFIGWSDEQRRRNLHLVVNNARFLILPWIDSKNLASRTLSLIIKRLPMDWIERYNYSPVLMESFVQKDKFEGTCYKAANWIRVGTTKGRGKLDRYNLHALPRKDIWLYPLSGKFRKQLCG